jgi:F-type H+-transporting ATPase subunit b
MIDVLAVQTATESTGHLQQIASTFGVDWPHLATQIVSFGIVCVLLYWFAYGPILRMLEARREQIAAGLANAEKIRIELARIADERQQILIGADLEGRRLIEEARAAAVRTGADEIRRATAAAERILERAREEAGRERAQMLADAKHEIGRLVVQTTASVTGKILTADDHQRLVEETARQLAVA